MNDAALYEASVPVFRHYLAQIAGMVRLSGAQEMDARLVPDAFSVGEHFHVAQGFVLRITWPLMGQESPLLQDETHYPKALLRNCDDLSGLLAPLGVDDFTGASERVIVHRAGFADLSQNASEFLTLYGMPNFFFHVANAYATLRNGGVNIGKSDFDGLHIYPPDYNFETGT